MDDRRTPMEAEVLELAWLQEDCGPEDSYGTALQPKPQRSYTGLWVCLGLIVIAVCTVSVLAALSKVRVESGEGGWRLALRETEETQAPEDPVQDLAASYDDRYVPVHGVGTEGLQLRTESAGEALSPAEIYQSVSAAVVCVQTESYYGSSLETGVVVSADGYILSALDSRSTASSLTVSFADGRSFEAKRIGQDRNTGVCLLKIEASGLQTVRFAAGEAPAVGERVYWVSNPYGTALPNVFSEGMLSAKQSVELNGTAYTVLQSAGSAGSPGLGCPILDGSGRVLGLTTAIGSQLVSGTDPCLAVSAADLERIVASLEQSAGDEGCWLGLAVSDIPEEYLYFYGFPGSVWIDEVAVGTAAYGVLYPYDVITAVDGREISGAEEYESLISAHAPGDRVLLTIFRNGSFYRIALPVLQK